MPFLKEVSCLFDDAIVIPSMDAWLTFLNKFELKKGKSQIIGTLFLAEIISEADGVHYLKGGDTPTIIFPPINFSTVDPVTLKLKKNRELNNGRLAMISIMSFVAAANIPGSVPALTGNPMF
jgi:hypothetical protein